MQGFFLGTHMPNWLEKAGVPLFISRRRLADRKRLPRAIAPWSLDSGGFTELSMFGKWTIPPKQYVAEVRRFQDEIGNLMWASIQDWMQEPVIREKTGLTVAEHSARTVRSYLELMDLAPDLPWAPVIQGWSVWDYYRCSEAYLAAGVDLKSLKIVGLGSVCRRQFLGGGVGMVIEDLALEGIRLHGFGFKTKGISAYGKHLYSTDSLAWSFQARKQARELSRWGHALAAHQNDMQYALDWREDMLARVGMEDLG